MMIMVLAVVVMGSPPAPAQAPPRHVSVPHVHVAPVVAPAPPVVVEAPEMPLLLVPASEGPAPAPLIERRFGGVPMPPMPALLPDPAGDTPAKKPAACAAKLGTAINFVADPPEAFKLASAEKKLVFVIHLSGNFEDTEFT
jgi:hypothetical protein